MRGETMEEEKKENWWQRNWLSIVVVAVLLVAYFLINAFVVSTVRVSGPSMEPNLVDKERLAVYRMVTPQRGDVISFNAVGVDPKLGNVKGNYLYIKRVIGLPGDTVSFKNNKLLVNGHQVNQNFISKYQGTTATRNLDTDDKNWTLVSLYKDSQTIKQTDPNNQNEQKIYPWLIAVGSNNKVPANCYFVLGDHRSVSNDGRYFGFVPKDKIIGVNKSFPWSRGNNYYINRYHHEFFEDKNQNNPNIK